MQHAQQTERSPVNRKYVQRTRSSSSAFQHHRFFQLRIRTPSTPTSLDHFEVCSQTPWLSSALVPGAVTLHSPRRCTGDPPITSVLRRTSTTWIVVCTQQWRARCGRGAVSSQRPDPPRIERRATQQRAPLLASGVESPNTLSTTGAASRQVGLRQRLYLLAVPLIWSTYSPSMRFLFQFADVSPSAALLNLGPALCGALGFLLLFLIRRWGKWWFPKQRERAADSPAQHAVGIRIGIELGVYMFVGTCLQLVALQFSPASQVGFLLQVSLVFTALLQRWTERRCAPTKTTRSLRYSGAIVCNLLGTALLILDDNPDLLRGKLRWHPSFAFIDGYGLLPSKLVGQLCALAAAMLYALFTVRLSDERIRTASAFTVASAKTTTLAALSALWFFVRPRLAC
ncbi:hypothetical protein F1559_001594 [Cyanidiococcus yangmingshanensis]|uniref:Uncharacterized protein n=1 Tax=Cyanidiococcus yangmingshanensis TaxID=2690220 RepID=A0A7J7IMM1_9RHOD|nr:hypothetical protein F1559_001594 [Cyanidiococcus yangmingshanensis]